jgi:hypothetical protein
MGLGIRIDILKLGADVSDGVPCNNRLIETIYQRNEVLVVCIDLRYPYAQNLAPAQAPGSVRGDIIHLKILSIRQGVAFFPEQA